MCRLTFPIRTASLRGLLGSILLATGLLNGCSTDSKPAQHADKALITHCLATLKPYLKRGFNRGVAFYVDLTRPSNQPRFFVADLQRNRFLAQGLCCNGRTDTQGNVIYSNQPNSSCSSRGAAKVSYSYHGQFGKAYKLEGLEPSNSNMFARAIVLHAHSCIAAEPQSAPICVSKGCPTVNPAFLATLAGYIDHSAKSILLYIE